MNAYLTFGAITREIGTKIKALIQNGPFLVRNSGAKDLQRAFSFGTFREDRSNTAPDLQPSAYASWESKAAPHPKASVAQLPR
jgi:hypothetical protein